MENQTTEKQFVEQHKFADSYFFSSSDINLIASFCCYGYKIHYVNKQDPSKAIFYIKRDKNLDELIRAYFCKEIRVEPMDFANAIKALKTRIYNT
ncbi:MAG: hypothetical protein UR28_C0028G0023 [Candidatus Peregrinibacteria bacterium GW2011_GWF2_33_10]|nr:MAG: hypothetical protein UR28_C0028G0023 [Candidatus Peregrinibacteria bacterium GW2011_GWF2_33_10]OGJ45852.1 MAG: hypothetical protein A2263_03610 [Candidatus Peregrinibacteria bacterium RIFOXYA2_FULL_33_21]OGJ51356.1 MAG: hypothetical protein A2307_02285 [Candidatus Peregrinibacteria bacterium RIFOXYB2_FULL_33_20]